MIGSVTSVAKILMDGTSLPGVSYWINKGTSVIQPHNFLTNHPPGPKGNCVI